MYKKIAISAMLLSALPLLGAGCINKNILSKNPEKVLPPTITVSAQKLGADNQIVIDKATIGDDGWIVIHEKQNGLPGPIIGYTSLLKGEAKNVKIAIDKTNLTPSLIAMLHYDRGEKGAFESPGADGPVILDQQVIMGEFNISNYGEVTKTPAPAAPVSARKEFIITAKQWSFSPAEIRVKKGDTVILKLKTVDVAHGYSIPEFGVNAEITPGKTTVVEFKADKAGTFTSACTVYCGVGHMGMSGKLIVE